MRKTLQFEEGQLRLALREEKEYSILNLNGAHLLYLNQTATDYVKMIMEELDEDQVINKITGKYKVEKKTAKKDYEQILFTLLTLASRKDVCPFSFLGVESIPPFSKDLHAPHRFDLAVTYRCNNDCFHCYTGGPRKTKELTTDQWKQVIDIIDSLDVGALIFTGGEPLLREDLVNLVQYSKNMVTGLVTNGRLLTEEMVSHLEKEELDHVQITVEGFEETHNAMVCAEGWSETIQGIKNCVDSSIYTLTNTTLTTRNVKEVPQFLEFLTGLGIERIALNSIIKTGRAEDADYGLTAEEVKNHLEIIKDTTIDLGLEMVWYTPTRRCDFDPLSLGLGLKMCSAARINVTVEPDGRVIPCQSWFEGMGYILEDSWDDIWNSPLAKSIRDKEYMPDECSGCPMEDECTGGCPLGDVGCKTLAG
jgi:radical SAM protein with 4Fe4S-binding SPASM domain